MHVLSTLSTLSSAEVSSLVSIAEEDAKGEVDWEDLLRKAVIDVEVSRRGSIDQAAHLLQR